MNDLAWVLAEVTSITNHTVIETCTDCDQHIAMLHSHIGFVGTVHARHTNILVRRARIGTQAHQGCCAGCTRQLDQFTQFVFSITQHYTTTNINQWALGAIKNLYRFLDLSLMAFGHRRIRAHLDLATLGRVLAECGRNIFGHIDQHRTGTACGGNEKRLANGIGQIPNITHQEVVLDARTSDTNGITLLEGIFANCLGADLSTDDDHRNGV